MKKVFVITGMLFLSTETLSVAQSVRVYASPVPVYAVKNGSRTSLPVKFTKKDLRDFVVIYKEGYATRGGTAVQMLKEDKEEYTITLEKINKPAKGFKSRKIEFTRFVDATDNLGRATYTYNNNWGWGPAKAEYSPGADLTNPRFANAANNQLMDWGFNMVETNAVFNEKGGPDLAIAGEVIATGESSVGPGFQVSVLVDWSVYDVRKKKVVLNFSSGGYSDSRTRLKFTEELVYALRDALISLMSDKEFQRLSIVSEIAEQTHDTTNLPIVAKKNFTGNSDMVKSVVNSVVTVKTNFGHGSGFLISSEGHILTNEHVISGAEKIEIIFDNGFTFPGTLLKSSEHRDVALIKVTGNGFKPLPLNSSEDGVDPGAEVIAVGTPADISLGQTVTKGIISGKRIIEEQNFIQTDVTINPGNSGGPLLNNSGEVIGIIVSKIVEDNMEGLGFAIPIREACTILNINFQ
jgi:trypsin-like peptidase